MLKGIISGLDRFNTLTTETAGKLATLALIIMTALVCTHVVMRYGFHYSFEWTEEVARCLMVAMTFLYFPTGHKKGMNIAVEFAISSWANTKPGKLLKLSTELLAIIVLATCLQLSIYFVQRGMNTSSQALQITMGYVYMVVPVCFGITLLCAIENLLRILADFMGVAVLQPAHQDVARVD